MFYIYKLIFLFTLFMGTLISISSHSWLGTWIGLEINLLSFIPILNNKNNPFSSESSIKYFLIQALASSLLLFSILMIMLKSNLINEMMLSNKFLMMIINSALLTKMGAAPFHFWFPEIIEGMSWINSFILMTWQKIAPMMLISYTMIIQNFIIFIVIMSTFIGSIGGLNQISLRKLMAYSSINHIGWMLSSFLNFEIIWLIYFIIYSIIIMSLTMLFNKLNIFFLKQMYISMSKNFMLKFSITLNMLSLGGLPPFLGFMPKWLIIQELSKSYWILLTFMIMMTLITLFFYLRITYSTIMISNMEMNFNLITNYHIKNNISISMMSFISINGLILFTIYFNLY